MKTIKEALENFFSRHDDNKQLAQVRIRSLWATEMGNLINKETEQLNFSNGKLFVKINNSIIRNELKYSKEVIIKNLNAQLGNNIIKEIVLV